MKRLIALAFISLAPLSLSAQPRTNGPAGEKREEISNASALAGEKPLAPVRRRRRGSMVGYINDSEIGSKIQVRGDLGYHIDAPDRAEFFYAKCGCYRDLQGNPAYDPDAPGPGPRPARLRRRARTLGVLRATADALHRASRP